VWQVRQSCESGWGQRRKACVMFHGQGVNAFDQSRIVEKHDSSVCVPGREAEAWAQRNGQAAIHCKGGGLSRALFAGNRSAGDDPAAVWRYRPGIENSLRRYLLAAASIGFHAVEKI